MKSFTLNTNSWHFKLAEIAGVSKRRHDDFCSYFRKVAMGAFLFTLMIALSVAETACVADFFAWIVAGVQSGFVEPRPGTVIFFCELAIAAVLGLIYLFATWDEKRNERKWQQRCDPTFVAPEPGFVKLAYRKFKDKTCFQINFVGA